MYRDNILSWRKALQASSRREDQIVKIRTDLVFFCTTAAKLLGVVFRPVRLGGSRTVRTPHLGHSLLSSIPGIATVSTELQTHTLTTATPTGSWILVRLRGVLYSMVSGRLSCLFSPYISDRVQGYRCNLRLLTRIYQVRGSERERER